MAVYDIPSGASKIQFTTVLNDIGSASFSILKDVFYEALPTAKEIIDKFNIKIGDEIVFCFVWEQTKETELANGDIELTISGSGTAGQFERVVLYPLKDLNQMDTTNRTIKINGNTINLTDEMIQGVYFRGFSKLINGTIQNTDPRKIGNSVGEVWNVLLDEANYRSALIPSVTGFGETDAGGNAWQSFSPEGFSWNVQTKYLDILNDMASNGFLYYRQEGQGIYIYNPLTPFYSIDINSEKSKISGYESDKNCKNSFNSCLIASDTVVTSYRTGTLETEGSISANSDNPMVHASTASNLTNSPDWTKKINMLITPNEGKNPLLDFHVGDRLKLDNKLNNNRILNITVQISDDSDAHIATIEMSGDMTNKLSTKPTLIKALKDVEKLKLKSTPSEPKRKTIEQSSDGKSFTISFNDGTTRTLSWNDDMSELINQDGESVEFKGFNFS